MSRDDRPSSESFNDDGPTASRAALSLIHRRIPQPSSRRLRGPPGPRGQLAVASWAYNITRPSLMACCGGFTRCEHTVMSAPGPEEAVGVLCCKAAEERWKGLGHLGWSATDPSWGRTLSHNSLVTDGCIWDCLRHIRFMRPD